MKQIRKTIWTVKQVIIGKDEPQIIAFETKESAMNWYNNHEYCEKPVHKSVLKSKAKEMLKTFGEQWYNNNY